MQTEPTRVRIWRNPSVVAHVAVVALLVALLTIAGLAHDPPADTPDANIGAGIVGLALGVLGLPWSLAFLRLEFTGSTGAAVFVSAAAMVNVGIHAAWRARTRR